MTPNYWHHLVLHGGVLVTFQDLVDEWTSFVWDRLTDQYPVVPDARANSERDVSYGLDLRRKIERTVLEMQDGGEPVGGVEEVAVADLLCELLTRGTKSADGKPLAFEQHHDVGLAHPSRFGIDPRIRLNHRIEESQWNTPVQLGSRSVTFRQVVRGWAAEVWLIYEAQDPAGHNPRDWTLHDFAGALSFRSILSRAQRKLQSDAGRELVIHRWI